MVVRKDSATAKRVQCVKNDCVRFTMLGPFGNVILKTELYHVSVNLNKKDMVNEYEDNL